MVLEAVAAPAADPLRTFARTSAVSASIVVHVYSIDLTTARMLHRSCQCCQRCSVKTLSSLEFNDYWTILEVFEAEK